MVITCEHETATPLGRTAALVRLYVAVAVATIVALGALGAAGSSQATSAAWGHAIVVGVFALLLPLRLRSARRGSAQGLVAVGIIAAVVAVVNVVEAALPHAFPVWMRVEMVAIAALMIAVVASVRQARR